MNLIPKILSEIETTNQTIYRGQANIGWPVKPSIGRHYSGDWLEVLEQEESALAEFKKRSVPYLKFNPNSDLEWLSLMQHHGCPTRLIDFTTNPLVALFFASEINNKNDGEFIIANYKNRLNESSNTSVFKLTENGVYFPSHLTDRITNQSGCFVVSARPNITLNPAQLTTITIKHKDKPTIRHELKTLGITSSNIYPGLDGICRDLADSLIDELAWSDIFN